MPSRTTTYTENGLTYQITVVEENGSFFAEITVLEGHMDVNAVYYGDDNFSGPSASLGGSLNMNGAGSQLDGQPVQWDDAVEVSSPGLGSDGINKPSYLTEGETLRVELNINSLDDIDVIGVRATSTSTPEGSIKGVSLLEEEDNGGGDDDEPTYDKLFFVTVTAEDNPNGNFDEGVSIFAEDNGSTSPNDAFLPEGSAGTLDDYAARYREVAEERDWADPDDIIRIEVYQIGEDGELVQPPLILTAAEVFDPEDESSASGLAEIPVEDEDDVIDDGSDEDEPEDMVA